MRLSLALTLPLILWAPSVDGSGKRAQASRQKTMTVSATAYRQAGRTATGDRTRPGIVAADPRVLPLGTVMRITGPRKEYRGTYKVADVGSARFAHESREAIGVIHERIGQYLQRDIAIEFRVAGPVDLTHPAFADLRGD